jgi:histidine triad (HIT) family protein
MIFKKKKIRCPFCKIIHDKIPSNIIHEDPTVIVFLDINPISKGHCQIVPKAHYKDIHEVPNIMLKKVIITAKKISFLLEERLGAKGVNILHASGKVAQQSVPHFHLHLIPRYKKDKLDAWLKSSYKEKNLEAVKNEILNQKKPKKKK